MGMKPPYSKTTFVTVNHFRINPRKSEEKNSKTTFVTVNPIITIIFIINNHNSKTTFVTVNLAAYEQGAATPEFKNNFCYC